MFTTLFKNIGRKTKNIYIYIYIYIYGGKQQKLHKNVKNTSFPFPNISYFLNFSKYSIRYFSLNCEKGVKTNYYITMHLKYLFINK